MASHTHKKTKKNGKRGAWVVDVNMGYGHSRPAYALKDLANGEVLSANDYEGIPQLDLDLWTKSRELYEKISRMKSLPLVGGAIFGAMDAMQRIQDFYPRRDLSRPSLQTRQIYHLIKKGLGKHLVEKMSENPVPMVATFFIPAFFAEYYDYPGEIYCVTTDADISRAWAPMDPKSSRIKYFASNGRVKERLMLYGVREENILLTGFPMPKELIGGASSDALKDMLIERICNLDPNGIFRDRYQRTLKAELGAMRCGARTTKHPLTLTYVVGGAGAQRELGVHIMESLKGHIKRGEIRMNLVAGTRKDVADYFGEQAKRLGLKKMLGTGMVIPEFESRAEYFKEFNKLLMTTDIIWTKPSEMSFFTALGFPIIMSDPIGSQEEFNRVWLDYVGGGVPMANPKYTDEWLFDWINSGGVARMAWSGFVEAPTHGTYRIEDIVLGRKSELHPLPLIV